METPILHRLNFLNFILSMILLSGCDIDLENNVPGVPQDGRFAVLWANQHNEVQEVQVAFAHYDNGEAINLVGGNVVRATIPGDGNTVLLLDDGFYTGSYVANLDNPNNFDVVDFVMDFQPIEARGDRWYPVDLLNVATTPGEFFGATASVTLPPKPTGLSFSQINFNNINNDTVTINWDAGNDTVAIRSAVTCRKDAFIHTYGTIIKFDPLDNTDDGTMNVPINKFIYSTQLLPITIDFLAAESFAILQELLVKLDEIFPENSFFDTLPIFNPAESNCEIRVFLFRERAGVTTANGRSIGSRSAVGTIFYNP